MQDSTNKPTPQEDAFWKNPEGAGDIGLDHLTEDKEMEVHQLKARFRHRVVGAVVLVAALVTVLPIFFEEPAIEADQHAQTQIPPVAKEPFYKMELPVNEQPKVSMPADRSALRDLTKPNEVKEVPEARPTPELEQSKATAQNYAPSNEGSLYIQVLATSSEAGAMREMARYQAMGLPVYSVKVQKKAATLWRVRLGLFKTKEEADRVVKLLDSRKISHMPVQVEASAKRDMNRIAPTRTLKSATQEAHARSVTKTEKAATETVKQTSAKSSASQASKSSAKNQSTVKSATKNTSSAKSTNQSEKKSSAKKPVSADPLGDLLKSTREDVITQKLREARQ